MTDLPPHPDDIDGPNVEPINSHTTYAEITQRRDAALRIIKRVAEGREVLVPTSALEEAAELLGSFLDNANATYD